MQKSESFPTEGSRRQFADFLATRYAHSGINLIVAVEFSSLTFAKEYATGFLPGVPVVFVAVEAQRLKNVSLPPKITGVVHQDAWNDAVDTILRIQPGTRQIVVIAGSSPSEKRTLKDLATRLPPYRNKVQIRLVTDLTIAEMVRTVSVLPSDTAVLQVGFISDARGETLPNNGGPKLMDKSASVPVYGLVGRNLGDGLVGGPVPAYRERYLAAAKMASRILKGANPETIQIQTAVPEYPMAFDWRQLQRWKIDQRRLPAHSLVEFRELCEREKLYSTAQLRSVRVWDTVQLSSSPSRKTEVSK